MGLRSAAYCCQRVTNALVFIHHQMGYWSINYLDDFAGTEERQHAENAFKAMGTILSQVGASKAEEKACAPSTRMGFLGNWFDTQKIGYKKLNYL